MFLTDTCADFDLGKEILEFWSYINRQRFTYYLLYILFHKTYSRPEIPNLEAQRF